MHDPQPPDRPADTTAPRCRIYPDQLPNEVRRNPKLSAEVRLYDALKEQLGRGWLVFYSVAWLAPARGGSTPDGETDFIVAHPNKGVLLIEVKGGAIRYDALRRQWISTDRNGDDHDIDPFRQVVKSKYALLEKLKGLRSLAGQWIDLYHCVAFPGVARPRQAISPDAPPAIIIGADDLDNLSNRIEEILRYYQPASNDAREPGQHLLHELTDLVGKTTVLRNPLSIETAEEEREILALTKEQFTILDNLNRVRRAAIGGCAGSGKTFLAVEKARRLARQDFRVLLTCYNRPLADHLAEATASVDNLDVMTFHSLCQRFAREAGLALPESNGPNGAAVFKDEYPNVLYKAAALVPNNKYDAIIVDEGQDFNENWWIALESTLREDKKSILYVFYDDNQTVYHNQAAPPSDLDLSDILLNENLRNTRAIFKMVHRHYQGEETVRPRGPAGRTVETIAYDSPQEMSKQLGLVLHRLLRDEGFTHHDIVVLTPKGQNQTALATLTLSGSFRLVPDEPAANAPHSVRFSSIRRFKGLERRVVIVAELDEEMTPEMCYVAFSRPRTHLILLGKAGILATLQSSVP